MKKLNTKGFTLIELLAVIVIMGILMVVAIPAVSRTIANTRKDTYLNTAKQYVNQVKTLWAADGFECGGKNSSITADGTYYIKITSADDEILEEGGTSPWKNDTAGYVKVVRATTAGKTTNTYSIYIVDEQGNNIGTISSPIAFDSLVRGNVTSNLAASDYNRALSYTVPSGSTLCNIQ